MAESNASVDKNDSSDDDDGSKLESSELGTKEYWDKAYKEEKDAFDDVGDEGTVWFGKNAVKRVQKWLDATTLDKENSVVLDLGCGNGATLFSLANSGWSKLVGIDYSPDAVELAQSIAQKRLKTGFKVYVKTVGNEIDLSICGTHFLVLHVMDITQNSVCLPQFDVILDKGTFDAISLCPDYAEVKKENYAAFVAAHLKIQNGLFCITSCNWAETELRSFFEKRGFEVVDKIPFPTFTFGGITGSTVTSLIFRAVFKWFN